MNSIKEGQLYILTNSFHTLSGICMETAQADVGGLIITDMLVGGIIHRAIFNCYDNPVKLYLPNLNHLNPDEGGFDDVQLIE